MKELVYFWKAALALMFLGASFVEAHPVSYQGGFSLMVESSDERLEWQAAYSLTSHLALGVEYGRDTMTGIEHQHGLLRVNYLVNRWNGNRSQANIYLYGGYGAVKQLSWSQTAFSGVEADYETRKIYFSGKASSLIMRREQKFLNLDTLIQVRAGIAPYVGQFEALHTWFIIQAQNFPGAKQDRVRVGPALRFFYRNVLWEIESDTKGRWGLNFMIHL